MGPATQTTDGNSAGGDKLCLRWKSCLICENERGKCFQPGEWKFVVIFVEISV